MTYHFPKKILGKSYLADLQKTYENLTTNLGKILGSFENRAPVQHLSLFVYHRPYRHFGRFCVNKLVYFFTYSPHTFMS